MAIARDHAEWLSLLDVSGPFLSLSVLVDAFPQGMEAHDAAHMAVLRQAAREWGETTRPETAIHQAWIRFVLNQTLGFPDELIAQGQALPPQLAVPVPSTGRRSDRTWRSSHRPGGLMPARPAYWCTSCHRGKSWRSRCQAGIGTPRRRPVWSICCMDPGCGLAW